jgi:sRNA-binding carbon storage regulator CsrA
MALVVARRHGQSLRLTTPEGVQIVVTLRAGREPSETKVVVEAPRSVVVERPERDRPGLGCSPAVAQIPYSSSSYLRALLAARGFTLDRFSRRHRPAARAIYCAHA